MLDSTGPVPGDLSGVVGDLEGVVGDLNGVEAAALVMLDVDDNTLDRVDVVVVVLLGELGMTTFSALIEDPTTTSFTSL